MPTEVTLRCADIEARISTLGAELRSLTVGGAERLWQGDASIWGGRSPLLFPNCGRYWNNEYRHEGATFAQKSHGFARTSEFVLIVSSETQATFGLHSTEDTLAVYPFRFCLFVTYRLSTDGLTVEWLVRNEGDEEMPFQIGAHPAFFIPGFDEKKEVRGYLSFETEEPITYLLPKEGGCVDPDDLHSLALDSDGLLPLTARTFDVDTYVINSGSIRSCTLLTAERRPWITVEFHMPILALWAPTAAHPECPFVAIEPWTGSCDTIGYQGPISERRHIQILAPSAHFRTEYNIRLHR